MIDEKEATLVIREITKEEVKEILKKGFISAVGHQSTAQILSEILDIPIPFNRIQIKLMPSDILIIFQILTRLEEGKVLTKEEISKLPFKFFLIERR
jgi:PIN domain nuclease of toxin-antitoxin system